MLVKHINSHAMPSSPKEIYIILIMSYKKYLSSTQWHLNPILWKEDADDDNNNQNRNRNNNNKNNNRCWKCEFV